MGPFMTKPQKDFWMIVAGDTSLRRTESCGKDMVIHGCEGIFIPCRKKSIQMLQASQ